MQTRIILDFVFAFCFMIFKNCVEKLCYICYNIKRYPKDSVVYI